MEIIYFLNMKRQFSYQDVRFEVSIGMKSHIVILWVMMSHSDVGYQDLNSVPK